MTATDDPQTIERRERAEEDARRKAATASWLNTACPECSAGVGEDCVPKVPGYVMNKGDVHVGRLAVPVESKAIAVPTAVAVGQWRKWTTETGKVDVFRIEADRGHRISIKYVDGTRTEKLATFHHDPSSPKDALDAKLATLTPEQRARVAVTPDDVSSSQGERSLIWVDAVCVQGPMSAWMDCNEPYGDDGNARGRDIDAMLAAIDRALAVPPKPLTRTEEIVAWCKDKSGVIIDSKEGSIDSGRRLTVAVDNRYIGVWWYPKRDADPAVDGTGTASAIIARIDAALAAKRPEVAKPVQGEAQDTCGCHRIIDETRTLLSIERKARAEDNDLSRTQYDRLRSQLAAVTAERDALAEKAKRQSGSRAMRKAKRLRATIGEMAGQNLALVAERDASNALNAQLREDATQARKLLGDVCDAALVRTHGSRLLESRTAAALDWLRARKAGG